MGLLTPTKTAMCDQLSSKYNNLISPVKQVSGTFNNQISSTTSMLSGMSFSSSASITSGLNTLMNQTNDILPGSDDASLQEMIDMVKGCDFFDISDMLSTSNDMDKSVFDNIGEFITDLSSSIPEFGAAKLLSDLTEMLGGIPGMPGVNNIASLLMKADKLLDCLSSVCGSGYSQTSSFISSDLDSLYTTMGVDGNPESPTYGEVDLNQVYTNAGIDQDNITNMNSSISGIKNVKQTAALKLTESRTKIKDLLKTKKQEAIERFNHPPKIPYIG